MRDRSPLMQAAYAPVKLSSSSPYPGRAGAGVRGREEEVGLWKGRPVVRETGWKPILHCAVASSRWVREGTGCRLSAAYSSDARNCKNQTKSVPLRLAASWQVMHEVEAVFWK
jgi:hypothetical protein